MSYRVGGEKKAETSLLSLPRAVTTRKNAFPRSYANNAYILLNYVEYCVCCSFSSREGRTYIQYWNLQWWRPVLVLGCQFDTPRPCTCVDLFRCRIASHAMCWMHRSYPHINAMQRIHHTRWTGMGRACYKQTRDAFQQSGLTGVRLWAVITLQSPWWEIRGRSRPWNNGKKYSREIYLPCRCLLLDPQL